MIPSDHFVRFYNETFKFLDERDDLPRYYSVIAGRQKKRLLELFRTKGLQAMYDYWSRIRFEENCGMELTLYPNRLVLLMTQCPSLGKVIDNDAGPCRRYCEHCPGWVVPLIEEAGFAVEYNLVGLADTRCVMTVRPKSAGVPTRVFCADIDAEGRTVGPETPVAYGAPSHAKEKQP